MENRSKQKKQNAVVNLNNLSDNYKDFNKLTIREILEKSDKNEGYKKSFFVLSEDLNEEDVEMSNKLKREFLLKKIFTDNKIISNKLIPARFNFDSKFKEKTEIDIFNESMILEICNGICGESRNLQLEWYSVSLII